MAQKPLTYEIMNELRAIMMDDKRSEVPVVKTVSLEFWEHAKRWIHHITEVPKPFTIALTGGSGSGKSMVRDYIVSELNRVSSVAYFTQDNYYRDFDADFPHLPLEQFYHKIDFDDPQHIRFQQLITDLRKLKTLDFGKVLPIPKLVYGTPEHKPTSVEAGIKIPSRPFLVTEGIHAFYSEALRASYDLKIYVDVDEQTRRERWLARNQVENRGITDNMWQTTVQCLHTHILPTRAHADLVINNVAPAEEVRAFIVKLVTLMKEAGRSVA
jgi:uridine kinase